MLLRLAADSFLLLFTRPFRSVLFKSLLLTAALLAGLFFALQGLIDWLVDFETGWINLFIEVMSGIGLVVGLGFLAAPVASLFVGLYVDEVAEVVERERYPQDRVGRELPLWPSLLRTVQFTAVVLAVNALALVLVLFFGLGLFIFFIANAFLLGREYFDLAALRHLGEADAKALRKRNRSTLFLAGLMIAGLLAIPFVNLAAPLFGTILMVQVYKSVVSRATEQTGGQFNERTVP